MNVLLVDNNVRRLEACAGAVAQLQHDVVKATSAEEARSLLCQRPFDVVVTEYKLGGVHGSTLLAVVAMLFPETRRMLFSGGALPPAVHAHVVIERMSGVDEFIRAISPLLS